MIKKKAASRTRLPLGRAMWNVTDVVALGLIGLYLYENNKAGN